MIVFVFHLFLLCVIKLVTCGCSKCVHNIGVLRFAKCVHVYYVESVLQRMKYREIKSEKSCIVRVNIDFILKL